MNIFAWKPLVVGGKAVAPVQSLPQHWMFQKGHSVLKGCLSGAGFDLGQDEPHCRVKAVSLLCLREHLSRTLSAFGVEVPCQKLQLLQAGCVANLPPTFSMISLPWIQQCLTTVWKLQKFPWQDE
jgi:hypothetical protein